MRSIAVRALGGEAFSLVGTSAIGLVLPWIVLARTGDPLSAGVVGAASAAPGVVAAIVGGALVDRVGRRRVAIVADIASALAVAALPVVDATVGLSVPWFILLGVLGALADVPGMTARDAMLPDLARASGQPVERLSGRREAIFGAAFLAGPLLAGAGLAVLPDTAVLWLTAGCSAAAAALTASVPRSVGGPVGAAVDRPLRQHWREGAAALRASRVAVLTTVLAVGSVFAISPLQGVVLPFLFQQQDAPEILGATLATFAVGLIAGSLGSAPLARLLGRRVLLCTALVAASVALVGFAAAPVIAIAFVSAAVVGWGFGTVNPLFPVLVAEEVPDAVRGQVLGLQNAGILTAFPLGVLVAGAVVQWGGVAAGAALSALAWTGFACYGVVASRWIRPSRTVGHSSRRIE